MDKRISRTDEKQSGVFGSVEELAAYLGISRKKTYDGLNDGSIPAIRLEKRFVIPRSAIERWLENAGKAAA